MVIKNETVVEDTKIVAKKAVKGLKGTWEGFKDFALKGNAFDLAVGVVIGGAVTALVTALVNSVINPLIAAIFGKPDMSGVWILTINGSSLQFGMLFSAVLNFFIIAAGLYFFFILPLNKLRSLTKKSDTDEEVNDELTETNKLLVEIRDLLQK